MADDYTPPPAVPLPSNVAGIDLDKLLQGLLGGQQVQPPPQVQQPDLQATRPTSLLGRVGEYLGGPPADVNMTADQRDLAGRQALRQFGIGMMNVGPFSTLGQGFAQGLGAAGASEAYQQAVEAERQTAAQDWQTQQQQAQLERLKVALPMLQGLALRQAIAGQPNLLAPNQGVPGQGGGVGPALTGDKSKDLPVIAQRESGGDPSAMNYVAKADPTAWSRGATATGKYQIVQSTWQEGMKLAGIDPTKYARAMDAPEAVQDKVAGALYDKYGTKPWDPTQWSKNWVQQPGGGYTLQAGAPYQPPPGAPTAARPPGATGPWPPAAPSTSAGATAQPPAPYKVATTGLTPPPPAVPPAATKDAQPPPATPPVVPGGTQPLTAPPPGAQPPPAASTTTPPPTPTPQPATQQPTDTRPDSALTWPEYKAKYATEPTPAERATFTLPQDQAAAQRAQAAMQTAAQNLQTARLSGDSKAINQAQADYQKASQDAATLNQQLAIENAKGEAKWRADQDTILSGQLKAAQDRAAAVALKTQEGQQAIEQARIQSGLTVEQKGAETALADSQKRLTDMAGAATEARNTGNALRLMPGIIDQLPQPGFAAQIAKDHPALIPWLTKAGALSPEQADATQVMQGLTGYMSVGLRPTGSGALRNAEMDRFQAVLPSMMQSPQGRRDSLSVLQTIQDRIVAEQDFASKYFRRIDPTTGKPAYNLDGLDDVIDLPKGQGGLGPMAPTGPQPVTTDANGQARRMTPSEVQSWVHNNVGEGHAYWGWAPKGDGTYQPKLMVRRDNG